MTTTPPPKSLREMLVEAMQTPKDSGPGIFLETVPAHAERLMQWLAANNLSLVKFDREGMERDLEELKGSLKGTDWASKQDTKDDIDAAVEIVLRHVVEVK